MSIYERARQTSRHVKIYVLENLRISYLENIENKLKQYGWTDKDINLFPWRNSEIVACPKCKWIGKCDGLSSVKYNVYTGDNPIPREKDVSCCPKCKMTYLLLPRYLGIFKFLHAYFKQEYV